MSQKISTSVVNGVTVATVTDAKIMDIFSTAISADDALIGTYGLMQKGAFVALGMMIQNNRLGRGWNPISIA